MDAEALLASGRWAAAYYLLGYAVECALKASVARQFRQHEVPERKFVNSFYTHNLDELLVISGLETEFENRARLDAAFQDNWTTIKKWKESVRYDVSIQEQRARRMHDAVANETIGILTWMRTRS